MTVIKINDIKLGPPTHSAHELYLKASYYCFSKKKKDIIFKKNKYNQSQYSRLEASFSQLALLLIGNYNTAKYSLVVDNEDNILGLAVEHIYYRIAEKEGFSRNFYTLNELSCRFNQKKVTQAEEIPVYFLNQFPHGFFSQLIDAEKSGNLTIDYTSLAKTLTSSYFLEEDDLHKGNFGFYLVEEGGKPKVVFLKIDHDLMFANSIMSFYGMRLQQFFYNDHAFDIHAQDLLTFPKLSYSANTYWPTRASIISNPWSDKEYRDIQEVADFVHLAQVDKFKQAKWLSFYKHILIPPQLSQILSMQGIDKQYAENRAHVAMVLQAVNDRQAHLRANLFSLTEFREFVTTLSKKEKDHLVKEIMDFCPESEKKQILAQVNAALNFHHTLCSKSFFTEGDTPLHTAIKLGDFRYEETLAKHFQLINKKNKEGKTALDCALELFIKNQSDAQDVRKDLKLTMSYLLRYGAKKSEQFNAFNQMKQIECYPIQTSYTQHARHLKNYCSLKELLRDLGEDPAFGLKFKKKMAVECIKQWINHQKNNPELNQMLIQLQADIKNNAPELKYIRQLRSSLWIVRQIRGLYGWTSTQAEIDNLINAAGVKQKNASRTCGLFSITVNSSSINKVNLESALNNLATYHTTAPS